MPSQKAGLLRRIDLSTREFRNRAVSRLTRLDGIDLVNAALASSGRAPITPQRYAEMIADLKSDGGMAEAFEAAKPVLNPHLSLQKQQSGDWTARFDNPKVRAIADCFYILIRAVRPDRVLETGVAYGFSSSFILAAMRHEQHGSLTSIDLPSAHDMEGDASGDHIGILVPQAYRNRWTLIRGDAIVALPLQFNRETPDIFIHDSFHSYAHMAFEYSLAARYLPPRGIIISDDTRVNSAFTDVMHGIGATVFNHAGNPAVAIAVPAQT